MNAMRTCPSGARVAAVRAVLAALALSAALGPAGPAAQAQRADRVWDVAGRCFKPADDPAAPCGVTFDVASGRYDSASASADPEDGGDGESAEAPDRAAGGLDPIIADDLAAATRRADPDAPDGLAALRESQRLLERSLGMIEGDG